AESGEIAFSEKIFRRGDGAIREIHLALRQAGAELLGSEINEHDLVGRIENRIGNGFPNDDAGDLLNGVATAFDMLDVDGRENVDAGVEQFEDILVAFRVQRSGRVGVRQLIDYRNLRTPEQNRVEVQFSESRAAIFQLSPGHDRQTFKQSFGLDTAMGFDN